MSSSHEIPNQEMEMQGLHDDENGADCVNEKVAVYENSTNDRNNIYEELKLRVSAKSEDREQISASKGKGSKLKTIFAIVSIIGGIAIASAAIVLFIKVTNNERTIEKFKKTSDLEALVPVSSCDQTSINGVYTLTSGRRVYCSDGWTVFQRRMDGSIPDFHTKTWEQYREGFGKFTEEFWLGLRKLHELTQQGGCRLRVDLQNWDNDKAYAEYSQFAVAGEENLFRLSVGGYSGTAGDSLTNNDLHSLYNINGMAFSTNERDNSIWTNCAKSWNSGGWWYNACFGASLNGLYKKTSFLNYAIRWQTWKEYGKGSIPIKFTQMGVRCD